MVLSKEQQTKMWMMLNQTRGQIGLTAYKDYIFGLLFYKYLSEKATYWLNSVLHGESWETIYIQDPAKSLDYMKKNLGYAIRPNNFFSDWQKAIDEERFNIDLITETFEHFNQQIAFEAKGDFEGIFEGMRFDSADLGANAQARISVMISTIELLSAPEFDLSGDDDAISDIYEYLVAQFATVLASDMGQYYTPKEISDVMARILTHGREKEENFSIYDPTVGSDSLLLTTASYMENSHKHGRINYFGQEKDATPYRLARMNLMMHGVEYNDICINHADTLASDWPDGIVDGKDNPRMFDAVMANPPYSAHWNSKDREDDPRWCEYGVAPKSKADYAFLLHCLYHLEDNGRMAIILPHGVLFRRGAEGRIRKALIDRHQIEAVIGFPDKLFLNTSIPVCLLVLRKNRVASDVLFIDASKDFEKIKNQKRLKSKDVEKIVDTVIYRKEEEKYSHLATLEEIKENDYNLNIPRYVDTYEEKKLIDIVEVSQEITKLNTDIKQAESDFLAMLNELAVTPETEDLIKAAKGVFE
ncbi:type I restriction-modification system subunit M [Enterococcus villorum]|uniref:site-specific DNA-methyltransferase (adenine-specific) n=2 Tax=Enterococcus villorum TaxID=112904 RepID=A0A511J4E9_9ENTE|nr:type I restriction-modification system subunit M [Enterococcus villorum]EOH89037.1 type I restriction-modification system, M subunit [Enterococcus villorum ATCC 700913]EOW76304.1 type I restriction-modification system, M subunit [Enterococcus villorum ATCC 700913]GEL92559.1 type I restriction-modification system subunit M [Enterococcus villorum]